MQKLCLLIFTVILLILPSAAQGFPRAEVFGGYQYTRIGGSGGLNANGWNAAVTGNVNRWFGVTGDFSGAYANVAGVSVRAYTYTFGPVISTSKDGRVVPFVHALVGGFHASAGFGSFSASTNGFATMLGGGVDAKVAPHIAVRVVQADWVLWHAEGTTEKNTARVSTGLVFRY